MFNIDFSKFTQIFKSKQEPTAVRRSDTQISTDKLVVEFANGYISYSLNNSNKIETTIFTIQQNNFEQQLVVWEEQLKIIVNNLRVKPKITILLKSAKFLVKHSDKNLIENSATNYFTNKLALTDNSIEIKHLEQNSYMIVEYEFLQQILFTFKEHNIQSIYDLSILNSSYIKSEKINLYLDISFDTFDIILNYHTIQKRNFNTNLSYLIDSCAKSLYMDFETSYQNLKLDFRNLTSYKELENSTKPSQKVLLEYCNILIEDIKSTLSYFSIYDNIDYIDNIYINGDILEFDFIIKILSDKLDINFISLNKFVQINSLAKTNITIFNKLDKLITEKIDINFDGLHYSDGRNEYIFIESGFVDKENLTSSQKAKVKSEKQEIKINTSSSLFYDDNNRPFWQMEMGELATFVKSKIMMLRQKQSDDSKEEKEPLNIKFILTILAVGFSLIIFIFVFDFVSSKTLQFENNINILEDRIQRVDRLKRNLIKRDQELVFENSTLNRQKIFWTQKIITIANLMPNEIWLSSVSLQNTTKKIENKEVTSQVMVLEARALPSAIGHISNIAYYMNKLLNANDDFKKDFLSISFGGASISQEYGYDVITFKLLCHFEKNINIKEIQNKQQKVKDKSIVENLGDITKNTKEKEKILDNL